MPRPSRACRILKWTGVGLSLIAVALWTASLWCDVFILLTPRLWIGMEHRGIGFVTANVPFNTLGSSNLYTTIRTTFRPHELNGLSMAWPFFVHDHDPVSNLRITQVMLPFWLLLLLTAIPTAWLWHRDRRRIRPGCCLRCGYDLTGNTSGVCSECGEKTAIAKPPPAAV